MYHPTRGGVRGGRDQFSWDDVKVDKHRENYLGHSIKAPVGRWQKGKDLHWYARDKKNDHLNSEVMKEEIRRIKEEEEQAMREALGLAPKRATKSHGNKLDKHEFAELTKRGSTAEDLGAGHAEAAQVQGLGFSRGPLPSGESSLPTAILKPESVDKVDISMPTSSLKNEQEDSEDESSKKRRKREERKDDKREERKDDKREERKHEKREERKHEKREERRHEKFEKRHSRDSDDKRKHKKHKEKRRHDSD